MTTAWTAWTTGWIRRPPGGGHLLFGLSHYPFLLIAAIVVIVALAYLSRRR